MKLAGDQLIFGPNCLTHLKTLTGTKALIVTGGSSMSKSGILQEVIDLLAEAGITSEVFSGVEPDPFFSTVYRGAEAMKAFGPDLIVALGGGSAMDAAKAMWIYYEHPHLNKLSEILPPNPIPKLRKKAMMVCIPSTSGTASEVSRSVVITDDETHIKYGIGNMELMPDVAICDPRVTATMPPQITAETGMDALTHALEALVSRRANYLSNILAVSAAKDIIGYLPKAYREGANLSYREVMLNASMAAGIAFTNVSLGIVHSMAHTVGSFFGVAHGLADAILLPYIIAFNQGEPAARATYGELAKALGHSNLVAVVRELNQALGIPNSLKAVIADESGYIEKLDAMAEMALNDGCTKTNPVLPGIDELKTLFVRVYYGEE